MVSPQLHGGESVGRSTLSLAQCFKCASLETVSYDSMRRIIRGNAYLDPIPFYNSDSILFHPAGKNGPHSYIVVALDFHASAT
jgi:hypothetical protein